MRTAKHELRECGHCKAPMRVYHCESRNGFGKYCSEPCALKARSYIPMIAPLLPATAHEIVAATRLDVKAVAHALRQMCKQGLAHPAAIVPDEVRTGVRLASHSVQYRAGPPTDSEVPVGNAKLALSFFADRAILAAMPGGINQLADKTGFTQSMIIKRLRVLRKPVDAKGIHLLTHVKSWKRPPMGQGKFIAVHAAQPGKDKPCNLKSNTQQEKYARWRKKLIRTGQLAEIYARAKARRDQRGVIQNGDPMLSAFFGSPVERRKKEQRAT